MASAEVAKQHGNALFAEADYTGAIREYSNAIVRDPSVAVYFSNRALAHKHLGNWREVRDDAEKALALDPKLVKGKFLLGLALLQLRKRLDDSVDLLNQALSQAVLDPSPSVGHMVTDIRLALGEARQKRAEMRHAQRIAQRNALAEYLYGLMDKDREERTRGALAVTSLSETDKVAELDSIAEDTDMKKAMLTEMLLQLEERQDDLEPPTHLCDAVTFELLQDPVITPGGLTYERNVLLTHMKRNGSFDPTTRKPLKATDLVPNLALRDAVDEWLKKGYRI
ncbi:hypothetical protein RI367_003495 [Sorochytrium milnesiophthora]